VNITVIAADANCDRWADAPHRPSSAAMVVALWRCRGGPVSPPAPSSLTVERRHSGTGREPADQSFCQQRPV